MSTLCTSIECNGVGSDIGCVKRDVTPIRVDLHARLQTHKTDVRRGLCTIERNAWKAQTVSEVSSD